jgi:phospholipid-binding lipoprotein MlaA
MKQACRADARRAASTGKEIVLLTVGFFLFLLISPAFAESAPSGNCPAPCPGHSGISGISPVASPSGEAGTEGRSDSRWLPLGAMTGDDTKYTEGQTPSADAALSDHAAIATDEKSSEDEAELPGFEEEEPVADPFAPWNRLMFHFNDKLYYWVVKPAAKGYNGAIPEPVRTSVGNFFRNVTMPVRFVSSLLAGRVKAAGIELARFGINSTAGLGGLFDIAKQYHLEKQESDLGLTFGRYGIGEGIYIVWPFLGPSSLRDTVGTVGDAFLDPVNYITPKRDAIAISAYKYFNYAALHITDYEDLVESAVEPYAALKNAYVQHRRSLINK